MFFSLNIIYIIMLNMTNSTHPVPIHSSHRGLHICAKGQSRYDRGILCL